MEGVKAAASVTSPVQVHALAASQNPPVTATTLHVDSSSHKTGKASTPEWIGSLASGWHKLTVKGWDWKGQVWKQTVYVYVK